MDSRAKLLTRDLLKTDEQLPPELSAFGNVYLDGIRMGDRVRIRNPRLDDLLPFSYWFILKSTLLRIPDAIIGQVLVRNSVIYPEEICSCVHDNVLFELGMTVAYEAVYLPAGDTQPATKSGRAGSTGQFLQWLDFSMRNFHPLLQVVRCNLLFLLTSL